MNGITIHLQVAEFENVRRHAEALGVECEDIALAAVQRMMRELPQHPQEIDREILHFRSERGAHLPMWNQGGRSLYPFEDAGDYNVPGL